MKKKSNAIVVTEKEQLNAAIKRKEPEVEIQGELAKKLKWMGKIKAASIIAILGSGVLISTAGFPVIAASTVFTGAEIAEIIMACGLSASLILSIYKGYDVKVLANGTIYLKSKI